MHQRQDSPRYRRRQPLRAPRRPRPPRPWKGQAIELTGDDAAERASRAAPGCDGYAASEVILAAAAGGVLVTDEGGVVRYCNRAAEELLGQPAGSLAGRVRPLS